jgi:type II secretory pathway component HofQ
MTHHCLRMTAKICEGGNMTFLQKLSGFGTKAALALMVIGLLAFAVSAQRVGTPRQGTDYGKPGFIGEPINLNVVNADIRDILNYITEQYGVNFVIDKSVKNVPVTVNVSDVPWNIALDSILQSQDLGVQVNGPILRVLTARRFTRNLFVSITPAPELAVRRPAFRAERLQAAAAALAAATREFWASSKNVFRGAARSKSIIAATL